MTGALCDCQLRPGLRKAFRSIRDAHVYNPPP
jgi:hypothetical protein